MSAVREAQVWLFLGTLMCAAPGGLRGQSPSPEAKISDFSVPGRGNQSSIIRCGAASQGDGGCPEEALGETPSGPIDGTNTNFSLARTPRGLVDLFRNGQRVNSNLYTVKGNVIFCEAANTPQPGDVLQAFYQPARLGFAEQTLNIVAEAAVLGLSLDPQFGYATRSGPGRTGARSSPHAPVNPPSTDLAGFSPKTGNVLEPPSNNTSLPKTPTGASPGIRALLSRLEEPAAGKSGREPSEPKAKKKRGDREASPDNSKAGPLDASPIDPPSTAVSPAPGTMSVGARKLLDVLRRPAQLVKSRAEDQ